MNVFDQMSICLQKKDLKNYKSLLPLLSNNCKDSMEQINLIFLFRILLEISLIIKNPKGKENFGWRRLTKEVEGQTEKIHKRIKPQFASGHKDDLIK